MNVEITNSIEITRAAAKAGNEVAMKYLADHGLTKRTVHLLIMLDETPSGTQDYFFCDVYGNIIERSDQIENESVVVYCNQSTRLNRNIQWNRHVALYMPIHSQKPLNRLVFTYSVSGKEKSVVLNAPSVVKEWLENPSSRLLNDVYITLF